MPRLLPLKSLLIASLLAALPLMAGCDTSSPDPVFADNGVRSTTFTPRFDQFSVNAPGDIATYTRAFDRLTTRIVDQGVVLLYARGDLIILGGQDTWTALPYTQGIDDPVDYTITYSYSFEPGRLYLDVISSAPGLVEDFIPDNIPFRLVTIPPGTALIPGLDYSRYEDVAEAYNLVD